MITKTLNKFIKLFENDLILIKPYNDNYNIYIINGLYIVKEIDEIYFYYKSFSHNKK